MKGLMRIALMFAMIALLFVGLDRKVPPQHLPWRGLDVDAPVGMATRFQLFRVSVSPNESCARRAREAEGLYSVAADPKVTSSVCGWEVARILEGTNFADIKPGEASMQCPLTLGSYIWMQEIDKAAQTHLGSGLKSVHHVGTYSCRRQNGNQSGAWSEHAFSNAWDVIGFELEDGRMISVLKDWNGEAKRRKFLRDIRNIACKIFRVTLSPDYNAAHKDHFHVDMGPNTACR